MKLPLDLIKDEGADKLVIELWDFDFLSGNDKVGDAIFDLNTHNIIRKA